MKTYPIILSKVFPSKHQRQGEATLFRQLYEEGQKIHTIRASWELWENRLDIKNLFSEEEEVVLSLREWAGRPYCSRQERIKDLTVTDRIGVQRLVFVNRDIYRPHVLVRTMPFNLRDILVPVNVADLAANDGLSLEDFKEWFKGYDLKRPLAIIQFTNFRYK